MGEAIHQASRLQIRVAKAHPCWSLDPRFPRTAAEASVELERRLRELSGSTLLPYKPGNDAIRTLVALMGNPSQWDPIDLTVFVVVTGGNGPVSHQILRREARKFLRTLWRSLTKHAVSHDDLRHAQNACSILSDKSAKLRCEQYMREL